MQREHTSWSYVWCKSFGPTPPCQEGQDFGDSTLEAAVALNNRRSFLHAPALNSCVTGMVHALLQVSVPCSETSGHPCQRMWLAGLALLCTVRHMMSEREKQVGGSARASSSIHESMRQRHRGQLARAQFMCGRSQLAYQHIKLAFDVTQGTLAAFSQ